MSDAPAAPSLGARISGASLWMAFAHVAALLGSVVVVAVATRRLGDAQFGVFATVAAFVALGSVLLLGLPQAMVREAAAAEGAGDRARTLEVLGSGQAALLAAGAAVAAALVLAAPWASLLVDAPPGSETPLASAVRVAAVVVLLVALAAAPDAALQGVHAFRTLALRNMTATLVATAATLTALLAGASLEVAMATLAVGPALTFALSVGAARRHGIPAFPLVGATRAAAARLLRFGLPLFVNEATYVVHTRVDSLLLLVWLQDPRFVGWYNAALTVAVTALVPPRLLMRAFLPAVAQLVARGQLGSVAAGVRRATGYLAVLVVPIVVGGAALAEPILTTLFPDGFAVAAPTLVLLLAGYGANALTYAYTAALLGMGFPRAVTWNTLPTAAAILGLHVLLIPGHGMLGAAIGASVPIVAGLVAYPFQAAAALRRLGHGARAAQLVPGRALATSLGASAAMAAALALLPAPETAGAVVAYVVAGAATYGVVFVYVLRGPTPEDRALVRELLARRRTA